MKLVNCTPHPIVVRLSELLHPVTLDTMPIRDIVYPSSGILPRILTTETLVEPINNIPCVSQTMGSIGGLPEPKINTMYIVSAMVLNASDRTDLVAPNTGKTCIRDEQGRIQAVTQLIRR